MGSGVFDTDDCRATFEDAARSAASSSCSEPAERFYGIEALFRDPFGNWFSLTERPKGSP